MTSTDHVDIDLDLVARELRAGGMEIQQTISTDAATVLIVGMDEDPTKQIAAIIDAHAAVGVFNDIAKILDGPSTDIKPTRYDPEDKIRDDAIEQLDRLGALLDMDDRNKKERLTVIRCRAPERDYDLGISTRSCFLPKNGFDHRAQNEAPRSHRRRRR